MVYVEWVAYVPEPGGVNKGDEGELLLLGDGDLSGEGGHHTGHGLEVLEVGLEVEGVMCQ